ncbi:MAG: NERD domain-containing protein [Solirubrobacterales bacterium]|nr:NERD domain-containing protein [Solirubrobacterales bacterium]
MQRRIDIHRNRAGRGGAGESPSKEAAHRTDELLGRLASRGWTVISDVDSRRGIDHVVVGPGGLFVIASHKPASGAARVKDGVVWLRRGVDARGDRPGVAINRSVLDAARAVHREVRVRTGRGPWVHPVVVLWCEFPQRVAESKQIAFVHGRDLVQWLTARPEEIDEPARGEIVNALHGVAGAGAGLGRHRWRAPHIGGRRRAA